MSIVERVKVAVLALTLAGLLLVLQLLMGDRAAPRHRANKEPPPWN
jgi:hypothetical protein